MTLELKPVFIETHAVKDFQTLLRNLERGAGEGRLAAVYGRAGRGKTRTVRWRHAHDGQSIYLRMHTAWSGSPGAFLSSLAYELGLAPCYKVVDRIRSIVSSLAETPRTVFIDEIEKMPHSFIEIVRDLSDESGAPFVFVGEEALLGALNRDRRSWSRTQEVLHFQPLELVDVITYAKLAGSVTLPADAANVIHKSSGGDFRLIKRDLRTMFDLANSKRTDRLDAALARSAVEANLRGRA